MGQQVLAGCLGHALGRKPLAPVGSEASDDVRVLAKEQDAGPWPSPTQPAGFHLRLETRLRQHVAGTGGHTLRDVRRQVHHRRRTPDTFEFPALSQHDGMQRPLLSHNPYPYLSTARRVEPPAHQFHLGAHPHPRHGGQEDVLQIGHRRSPGRVRAASQRQRRFSFRQRQRQKHRLQHQAHRPGAASTGRLGHVEGVFTGTRRGSGNKGQRLRVQLGPLQARSAHGGGRSHGGEMLRSKARLSTPGADVLDAQRSPGEDCQCQRSTQHLPPTLAVRAVNLHHHLDFGLWDLTFTFPSRAAHRRPDAPESRASPDR